MEINEKVIFLTTTNPEDPEGEPVEVVVDESYIFNPEFDLAQQVAWVPEWWETTKIGTELYIKMQPLKISIVILKIRITLKAVSMV